MGISSFETSSSTSSGHLPIVELSWVVRFDEFDPPDQRVQLIKFVQGQVQLPLDVLLKLMSSSSGSTHCGEGLCHPFLLGQLQEGGHVLGGEPDEVQPAPPLHDHHLLHLLLEVPVARVPIGEVVGEVASDVFHTVFLQGTACVCWLEIYQLQ